MRTFRYLPLTLVALAIGCVTDPEVETYEVYPRTVELIVVTPDSIGILINMNIGPNLCYRFLHPSSDVNGQMQTVRFIAERPAPNTAVTCLQALSSLNDTLSIGRLSGANILKIKLENGNDTTLLLLD